MHEGFDFGHPSTSIYAPDFGLVEGDVNVWPAQLGPSFKKVVMEYFDAVAALGRKMAQIFALSLDLDEAYFDKYITLPAAIARVLYYPPQMGEVDMRALGIGAHRFSLVCSLCLISDSDYELFTILAQQDDISALQVKNRNGEWIHADPIPVTLHLSVKLITRVHSSSISPIVWLVGQMTCSRARSIEQLTVLG